jgi:hypothetical protein
MWARVESMNYERRLRKTEPQKTVTRTITIHLGPDEHPGYVITVSDVTIIGDEMESRSTSHRTKEHTRTWEDAVAFANGVVESSEAQGFALLPRNAL